MEYYYLKVPIPKRPWMWFRYRIATILLLIAICSIVLAWWRDHAKLAGELHQIKNPTRGYSAAQATGKPNTVGPADTPTAWCPSTSDGGQEWLRLEYEKAVVPTAILIHENYGPGAVVKVTHQPRWGKEQVLWEGTDPTARATGAGVSRIPISTRVRTSRIKIYVDAARVPDYNEIDAVGLEYGDANKPQTIWAIDAEASSYYGQSVNFDYSSQDWLTLTR